MKKAVLAGALCLGLGAAGVSQAGPFEFAGEYEQYAQGAAEAGAFWVTGDLTANALNINPFKSWCLASLAGLGTTVYSNKGVKNDASNYVKQGAGMMAATFVYWLVRL